MKYLGRLRKFSDRKQHIKKKEIDDRIVQSSSNWIRPLWKKACFVISNLWTFFGYKKTFQRTQERFYWPGMNRDFKIWVVEGENMEPEKTKPEYCAFTADMEAQSSNLAGRTKYHWTATGIWMIQVHSSSWRSIFKFAAVPLQNQKEKQELRFRSTIRFQVWAAK